MFPSRACKVDFDTLSNCMDKKRQSDGGAIAELMVHLGRIASEDHNAEPLTPAQWTVLRYFARANRFSRSPSAFAAFHGTTRGTASQLIKSLETDGYLRRSRSQADGRSIRIDVTEKGTAILPNDPLTALVSATNALSPAMRGQFAKALQRMLCEVSSVRGQPVFGTCASCEYLNCDYRCQNETASYGCNYVNEPLDEEDLEQLCVSYLPANS